MLKLKLQYFGHLLQRVDSLEKTLIFVMGWGKEMGTTEDEMAGWHHRLDGCEFEWTPGDGDGQGGWCAAIYGVAKSQTRLSEWTELNWTEVSSVMLIYCYFTKHLHFLIQNKVYFYISFEWKDTNNLEPRICVLFTFCHSLPLPSPNISLICIAPYFLKGENKRISVKMLAFILNSGFAKRRVSPILCTSICVNRERVLEKPSLHKLLQ